MRTMILTLITLTMAACGDSAPIRDRDYFEAKCKTSPNSFAADYDKAISERKSCKFSADSCSFMLEVQVFEALKRCGADVDYRDIQGAKFKEAQ